MNFRILLLTALLCLLVPLASFAQDADTVQVSTKQGLFKRIFSGKGKRAKRSADSESAAVSREGLIKLDNSAYISAHDLVARFPQFVPDTVAIAELPMVDPVAGWYLRPGVMRLVNERETIYDKDYYTYDELNEVAGKYGDKGVALVPVFDLGTENARFEEAAGHKMLSVEGFRFVKAILAEFMDNTNFEGVAFIVTEGKYRTMIEEFMAGYLSNSFYFTE